MCACIEPGWKYNMNLDNSWLLLTQMKCTIK
jgi:hypothetical protein